MLWLALLLALNGRPDGQDVAGAHRWLRQHTTDVAHPMPRKWLDWPAREPRLVPWLLPYEDWEDEYQAYFKRHYNEKSLTFQPTSICMHFTVTRSAEGVWAGFERGGNMWKGDGVIFGHPSVQLMIDRDGTIFQLLPLGMRCTGAYGVNHKALSIEMVAMDEQDLLSRPQQIYASYCLVRWLMKRYHIPLKNVYGHNSVSLGRPFCPDFLDYADKKWPNGYPPEAKRIDPGWTYMRWLHRWLEAHP